MIVVADTSPINYFILLEKTHILVEIYGRVIVPGAVLQELQHRDAPTTVRRWALDPPSWVEVLKVHQVDQTLAEELGEGEREAISLALELRADLLLIDERAGRREAQERNLQVAGTLAVLLRAGMLGLLDFPFVLKEVRRLGFRVSHEIESAMLAKYYQGKKQLP